MSSLSLPVSSALPSDASAAGLCSTCIVARNAFKLPKLCLCFGLVPTTSAFIVEPRSTCGAASVAEEVDKNLPLYLLFDLPLSGKEDIEAAIGVSPVSDAPEEEGN